MKETVVKRKYNNLIWWFLLFSSFALGLFNELASVAAGIAVAVLFFINVSVKKEIRINLSIEAIAFAVIPTAYIVTAIWGVDKFNSLLGFAKFFPVLLFLLLIMQLEKEHKEKLLSFVSVSGAVMTVSSFVLMQFDQLKDYFSVDGRISGFFQYSNTFALFLIIGIIINAFEEKFSTKNIIVTAILVIGVFLTGSRTSFVLLILVVLAVMLLSKNNKYKIAVAVIFAVGVLAGVTYYMISGHYGAVGRFLTTSLNSGTLQGRLLYFKDAIRIIAKHPFGLGYMGYYFLQGSFQTGVYSNQFVHNELLQLMLDIGWIPALFVAGGIIKSLFSKNVSLKCKLVIAVISIHSMLDFDLQFIIIMFILMMCLDFDGREVKIKLNKAFSVSYFAVTGVLIAVSLYLSLSSFCYVISKSETAVSICQSNTMAQIEMLERTEDINEKNEIADEIISNNKYVSNAYSAKALYFYANGDIENMIKNKSIAIENNKYFIDEYIDYCTILIEIINLYNDAGDYDSASYCCEQLIKLNYTLQKVKENTDSIAYKLQDKPVLELPSEYQKIIDSISETY
ncbi:MAG: O-antigen ligase family protein [Acetobacter sp.]|nr:O-antigen ligase family protein [Bacteroides sp.]MCM1341266.1 O-antigen ligase family protein [Acetobacter sp.]MCM1433957.1 O-antigen ligase family protein [Clostridiales bacterium]